MAATLSSSAGILCLLSEKEQAVQVHALQKLNTVVDYFWAEISETLPSIEVLYEDETFPDRPLAALVISKVYYHLGEHAEALAFALGASAYLGAEAGRGEYVETIKAQAIDTYTRLRRAAASIDVRLAALVETIVEECIDRQEYRQALGMAIDSERVDILTRLFTHVVQDGTAALELLGYVKAIALDFVTRIEFRNHVLALLARFYAELEATHPDYLAMVECWLCLDEHAAVVEVLLRLLGRVEPHDTARLTAYQIAFHLYARAPQRYLIRLLAALPPAADAPRGLVQLRAILTGDVPIRLELDFLCRNNHTDRLVLVATKARLNVRSSIHHSGLTYSHALMQCGTTNDDFLLANMEFLTYASNWSKFSATAGLGLIHRGQLDNSLALLAPYLPLDFAAEGGRGPITGTGSVYSEGGSLYALGLIHAGHGGPVMGPLLATLKTAQNEVILHGACLGIGLAAMGSGSLEVYEALRAILFTDSAVAGEAAGVAIGLVLAGTGHVQAVQESLQYARETQHEKIIRGLALGLALVHVGLKDAADATIDVLLADKDAVLRYGGVYCIGLAYHGTNDHTMIQRCLHLAVSDTNDDVRRAAVTCIGFLCSRVSAQVPKLLQLLAESFNPHVRAGAAMALGIACAGTASLEAIQLLEPLTHDMADFVRQSALIALAMILIQCNEAMCPKVAHIRYLYEKIIADKYEDVIAKFGAIVAQGILDAGGRNVTLGLASLTHVIGLALFTQSWYWYPMIYFLSLALQPTPFIALDADLQPPLAVELIGEPQRPGLFDYPPPTKVAPGPADSDAGVKGMATLSITAKAKARARRIEEQKRKKISPSSPVATMDVDIGADAAIKALPAAEDDGPEGVQHDAAMDVDPAAAHPSVPESAPAPPVAPVVPNMGRVVPSHWASLAFKENSRYAPLVKMSQRSPSGIIMVIDRMPDEPKQYLSTATQKDPQPKEAVEPGPEGPSSSAEPAPPAPFEYVE